MRGPLVSVVVPAYDAASTLGATLASVLAQTHPELEVLVVDDGSTDATPEIVARAAAADSRVVGVSYGGNRGRSFARNEGMRRATGEWVALVDADDLVAANRIERLLAAAREYPDCQLLTDDRIGWRLDEAGWVVVEHRFPGRHTWRLSGAVPLDRRRHFTDRFGHLDLMVRREFLVATGAGYPEDMAIAEDLAFYNTLLFWPDDPRPVRVGAPMYYYRLAPSARSAGGPQAHARMVAEVVARTGSTEIADLYRRWGPAASWLFGRADRQLESEGRLRADAGSGDASIARSAGVEVAAPSAVAGVANLVGLKAMQWLGRCSDRSLHQAIVADIEGQLRRSAPLPP